MIKLIVTSFLSLLIMPTAVLAGDLEAEIRAIDAKVQQLQNTGDAASIAKMYAHDGVRLPPDGSRIEGREAIQKSFQDAVDVGVTNVKLELTDVNGQGDIAWSIGTYSIDVPTGENEISTFTGNYTIVYESDSDGVWRIRVDTWNDDAPEE
ncbi:YybH family protein [Microbulbifer sp. 2304DJ12-6]|uniref:YybH family protein n=1 Tax=Microbulbifer sp. 2304DJ12-6 TaxID=3233340 RepID=UPI0039B00398